MQYWQTDVLTLSGRGLYHWKNSKNYNGRRPIAYIIQMKEDNYADFKLNTHFWSPWYLYLYIKWQYALLCYRATGVT